MKNITVIKNTFLSQLNISQLNAWFTLYYMPGQIQVLIQLMMAVVLHISLVRTSSVLPMCNVIDVCINYIKQRSKLKIGINNNTEIITPKGTTNTLG